jgi:anaerobic magnesium-protoporphyrin IX monomethyl ester cyclase
MIPLHKILFVRANPWKPRYGSSPPLGCMLLASAVRKWIDPNIEMKIIDLNSKKMSTKDLAQVFQTFQPDLVGFSALSAEHTDLLEATKLCKAYNRECPTVVGGPHATAFGDILIQNPNIDFVVQGEGEHTFVELLQILTDGGDPHKVKGLIFQKDGETVKTESRPFEANLDSIPFPAWDLVDLHEFSKPTTMNGFLAASPYAAVMSTRACPYNCVYCHSIFGKKYRERSVDNFMAEIEILHDQYKVKELHIIDDCFNLKEERARAICQEMVERRYDFKIAFPNGVRGDRMSAELIHDLKSAGAYMIYYAIESASNRIQKLIKKNLNIEKVIEAIEATYRARVLPAGFLMIGFPTETLEEIESTIKLACDSYLVKASIFTVVPFPRTELFEIAKRCYPDTFINSGGSLDIDYWSRKPFYSQVTGIDITAIQRRAYRRFYFSPKRVARAIRCMPLNTHVVRNIGYGLQSSFSTVEKLNRLRSRSATKSID